jgi:AbiV family abortive infection protein
MKKVKKPYRITPDALRKGFELSVSNGFSLSMSAMTLIGEFQQIALGLAQLGQEEIGKSLSILAAMCLPDTDEGWQWFWSNWRDHKVKAHRAFLYELFSPLRIELKTPKGDLLVGLSQRLSIPLEKEVAFYVNFDESTKSFVAPETSVSTEEAMNRLMSVCYLSNKAFGIYQGLEANDSKFRYSAIAEIAFRVCTENLYQQDMPKVFEEFRCRSERHDALIRALAKEFVDEKEYWQKMLPKKSDKEISPSDTVAKPDVTPDC